MGAARDVETAGRGLVGMGDGHRRVRLLLLLATSSRARERDLLGVARRPSPEPGIQSLDGAAADKQRRIAGMAVLPADGGDRLPTAGLRGGSPDRPALSVLDPHRARRPAGLARPYPCDPFESSRASRD